MLQHAINNVFLQLTASLEQLSDEQYSKECATLSHASVGKHLRHIIELFQGLQAGYVTGVVNYDKRKRDIRIETDKKLALQLLREIHQDLAKENKDLILEATYDEDSGELVHINTNYIREIAYNLEHTIHHMALIRIGINEISTVQLPENYGVASSTIQHRQACAQ
ncbi:MAG: hypothetical protein QM764_01575 [Chitinophagaceae bacterium]